MKHFVFPDSTQNIAALASSILKHYGVQSQNQSYPPIDELLDKAPRNIVLLLLDGLGHNILTHHLPSSSFLRRHQQDTLSSVFPPTTTAAATALETGLFPSQSGWLGWSVFWPPIGKNVALYPNTSEDGRQASSVHIGNTFLTAQQITERIRTETCIPAYSISEQGVFYAKELPEVLEQVRKLCTSSGPHFIYAYANNPDHLLHRHGCSSSEVQQWLANADRLLEEFSKNCPETLFLLTADHGFTDVDSLCLEDFPALEDTLLRKPSIEPRALNLFVKPGQTQEFLRLWQETVGNSYSLYTKEQVLEQQLFGPNPNHPLLTEMLGDYLAIAKTPLTLFPTSSYLKSMVATHGGMTSNELTVPLIVWESKVTSQ